MKTIKASCLCVCLLLFATACGGGNKNEAPADMQAAPAAEAPYFSEGGYGESASNSSYLQRLDTAGTVRPEEANPVQNKIIFTGNIYMETNDFDQVLENIQSVLDGTGGYMASSELYTYRKIQSIDYRAYHITLKVPVAAYKDAFAHLKTLGKLVNSSETADDVTAEYYDAESRLKTKKIEEERVLDMIARAEKIEDLIALEQRLGELREDIEVYETRLRNLERLTSYSTINMTVNEIDEGGILAVSDDLGVKIKQSFASSVNGTVAFFENIIVFLAAVSVPLVILIILVLVGVILYKIRQKSKK